jgi:hypothetical protein
MPKARELPSQAVLQSMFHYDRQSRELFAKTALGLKPLKIKVDRDGHNYFTYKRQYWSYPRTVQAWLGHPVTTDMQVGHINGNAMDTDHLNLQVLTPEENASLKKRNPNVDYVERGIIYSHIINAFMVRDYYRDVKKRRNQSYPTLEEARAKRDELRATMRKEIQDRPPRFEFV